MKAFDPFEEAAAELGCDVDEIEGTFPPKFVRMICEAFPGTTIIHDHEESESAG